MDKSNNKGYLHPSYAESLSEFGVPRFLSQSKGWILEREIPGFEDHDAMGCYPLFACQDWSQLHVDFEELGKDLVSLALVTDPFGDYDLGCLKRSFKDLVIPFKDHFIVDLQCPLNKNFSKHRRKHARHALNRVKVEVCLDSMRFVEDWVMLYDALIEKHNISGIRAFSRTAFAKQLANPGTVLLRAVHNEKTVGAQIYFVQNDIVYCHLGACSVTGYDLGAFYAMDWVSFEFFMGKARWLDLGGGAGLRNGAADGLSQYKRGWATETRTAYFCGRILNQKRYAEIATKRGAIGLDYFPVYRLGEFG